MGSEMCIRDRSLFFEAGLEIIEVGVIWVISGLFRGLGVFGGFRILEIEGV